MVDRERLEKYTLAIASGWFSATGFPSGQQGEYPENPRACPLLEVGRIVEAAVMLMKEVDDASGSGALCPFLGHDDHPPPEVA